MHKLPVDYCVWTAQAKQPRIRIFIGGAKMFDIENNFIQVCKS